MRRVPLTDEQQDVIRQTGPPPRLTPEQPDGECTDLAAPEVIAL